MSDINFDKHIFKLTTKIELQFEENSSAFDIDCVKEESDLKDIYFLIDDSSSDEEEKHKS